MAGVAFFETDPTGGLGATVGGGEGARAHVGKGRSEYYYESVLASTSSTSLVCILLVVLCIL